MTDRLAEIEKTLATQRTYVEVGRLKVSDPWLGGYEITYEQAEWLIAEVKRLRRIASDLTDYAIANGVSYSAFPEL